MAMQTQNSLEDFPELALHIHQAILNPHIGSGIVKKTCEIANYYGFSAISTSLSLLTTARKNLKPAGDTKLIALIAFPFGNTPKIIKKAEAEWAIEKGAEELELVPSFFKLSEGKTDEFSEEIAEICDLGLPVRVILDLANMSPKNLELSIESSLDAGVTSLQTGNGFGKSIEFEDIKQLLKRTRNRCSIKAVGGIKSLTQVTKILSNGADMIGTNFGAEIMKDFHLLQK